MWPVSSSHWRVARFFAGWPADRAVKRRAFRQVVGSRIRSRPSSLCWTRREGCGAPGVAGFSGAGVRHQHVACAAPDHWQGDQHAVQRCHDVTSLEIHEAFCPFGDVSTIAFRPTNVSTADPHQGAPPALIVDYLPAGTRDQTPPRVRLVARGSSHQVRELSLQDTRGVGFASPPGTWPPSTGIAATVTSGRFGAPPTARWSRSGSSRTQTSRASSADNP